MVKKDTGPLPERRVFNFADGLDADEDVFAFYWDGTRYILSVVLDVDLIT